MDMEDFTATAEQLQSVLNAAEDGCDCMPADGMDPCDDMYGGVWTEDADGNACEDDEDTDSGAKFAASAAFALAAAGSLLF